MSFNPLASLFRFLGYALTGGISFPRNRIGEIIKTEDGHEFTIFRQVIIGAKQGQQKSPEVTFRVRFCLRNVSPRQNKMFSLLPIPFFTGLPGFRSKLWMMNEINGEYQGLYEWDAAEYAEKYARSFAMKFMTMRAVTGSISYKIFPTAD